MSQVNAKLTGVLTDVFPVETPTPNITKRVFWLKEPDTERHPQHWELELIGEDVKRIQQVKIGDTIEVEVEVRGRQYNKRYGGGKAIFTSLRCVGIRLVEKLDVRGTGFKSGKNNKHDEEVDKEQQGRLEI